MGGTARRPATDSWRRASCSPPGTTTRADGLTNDDSTAFALQVCDLGLVSLLGIDLSDCNTGSDDRRDSRIHEEERDGWVFVKDQDRWYAWRR